MAEGAFVFDMLLRLRVVHNLPANAALPVRIAGGVRHDARTPIEADRVVFAFGRLYPDMTCNATVGGAECSGDALPISDARLLQGGCMLVRIHLSGNGWRFVARRLLLYC